MDPFSAVLTIKALDGLSTRSQVIAQNIANAGTPNYRPLRASFEVALAEAARQGPEAVAHVKPTIAADRDPVTGGELRLDLELADSTSTAGRYAALVEVLNRQLQIDALVVSGGK